jgi:2,4-dienoyl-CoA reductase-like NADH-dependent reductase (Old Yellow Enzyme family)
MSLPSLFQPAVVAGIALPNRLVMAPMTRRLSPEGVPGPDVAAYYRRRAEGGVGLIITEGTGIADAAALGEAGVPEFHGAGLDGWAKVITEVHAAGSKIIPQLWHVGGARRPALTAAPDVQAG